ncbi:heat shock protein DnaJ family protein [Basidiobolus meristosporus CBS 931.73]|uniref:Heat shock protein DnaJ family protein n=1 Tax=Basidiobolus meristosporus CBS 931.73 TaxID=1314790 RepID=A0A1Y1YYA2_9FUNG|nr:heat shock protein DnaJ family protein [Basidiobolus meristosporus CBS 931.73]|eukprot:ORY03013.1 heat shock protein DnaJ family protein [Basidiobolus meristosporus CBS 931.73]
MRFQSISRSTLIALSVFTVAVLLAVVQAGADYYAVLGISRDATLHQVKKAYRKLSKQYHPDKNPGDKEASKKFMELNEAYEALSDDEKRRIYDRYGEEGLKQEQQGGGHNPFDFFSQFFGGGGSRSNNGDFFHTPERRGPSINMDLEVDLKDLYLGVDLEVDIAKQVICHHCHGSGAKDPSDVQVCSTCNGRGIRTIRQQFGPAIQIMQTECDVCQGKGKVIKTQCPHCHGNKVERGYEQLTVIVQKGTADNHRIVYEKEGDQHPDITPGDIIFTIRTNPHERFTRQGHNLYARENITLVEALTGFEKTMEHLDGTPIILRRDGVTPSGFVQTLADQGMPHPNYSKEKGDLFVEYTVQFPTSLTEETKQKIKELLQ